MSGEVVAFPHRHRRDFGRALARELRYAAEWTDRLGARGLASRYRREAAAMLTHGLGVAWPDAAGERLAAEALRLGGVVALVFAHRWNAVDCKARIDAGGAA